MPNNIGFGMMPGIIKHFKYRNLLLELVDSNSPYIESLVFRGYPTEKDVNIMDYVDAVPEDSYFDYLFTCIYGLTAVQKSVRIEIDRNNNATMLYVMVRCLPSDAAISALKEKYPTFVYNLGRQSNLIYGNTRPFIVNNTYDSEGDVDLKAGIHGTIECNVFAPNGIPPVEKYMMSYGIALNLNISNYPELSEALPNYTILGHKDLYDDYVEPVIRECEKYISDLLDPLGLMKIKFKRLYMDDGRTDVVSTLSLKLLIYIENINGVEINELTATKMVFRPAHARSTIAAISLLDWKDAATYVQQIATALLSDNGTIFIPEITSVDTCFRNGKTWLQVFFTPHFGHFTKNQIFYGHSDIVEKYGREYYWLNGSIGSFIQFIFPTLNELADPTVLCYGRIMKDFIKDHLDVVTDVLTCKEIHLRIIAEVDSWVYFALTDNTILHDLGTFTHFAEYYLGEIVTKNEDATIENVLNSLIGAFCSADPDSLVSHVEPKLWQKVLNETYHGDQLVAIISFWERSVRMLNRSFADSYLRVRDAIFDEARKSFDDNIKEGSIRQEDHQVLSPTTRTKTYNKFAMAKLRLEGSETLPANDPSTSRKFNGNFLKRLFGKDNT